jgi:proteasome assembly chaperone (PAC2) family protein
VSDPLRIWNSPELRDPVLILAYAGWSDGGESATSAVTFLLESMFAEKFATLDLEEYLDFTVVRPHVRINDDDQREIVWPAHEFYTIQMPSQDFDLILALGVEPHMRWKSYARKIMDLVERTGIRKVVMLGAFLDEVIYSQPIDVLSFASDEALSEAPGLASSTYEGPTGIVGVLGDALARDRVPVLSLWARLPHYVTRTPNWRGSLALLQRMGRLLQFPFDVGSLEQRAAEFDTEVSDAIANDPQLAAYVRELKRRAFSQ